VDAEKPCIETQVLVSSKALNTPSTGNMGFSANAIANPQIGNAFPQDKHFSRELVADYPGQLKLAL
jgi:hypothetical protein